MGGAEKGKHASRLRKVQKNHRVAGPKWACRRKATGQRNPKKVVEGTHGKVCEKLPPLEAAVQVADQQG